MLNRYIYLDEKGNSKTFLKIICALILLFIIVFCFFSTKTDILYVGDDDLDGFVNIDDVLDIRFMLPSDIVDNSVDLTNTSISESDLSKLIENNYTKKSQDFGFSLIGPDFICLVAKDKSLFKTSLSNIGTGKDIYSILTEEIGIDADILEVDNDIQTNISQSGVLKIVAPIKISGFDYLGVKIGKKYEGYISLIQKRGVVSAMCLAGTSKTTNYKSDSYSLGFCLDVVKSFKLKDSLIDGMSVAYNNIIDGFSYESGGLTTYDDYSYNNMGNENWDTKGTYNKYNSNIGMYCFKSSFGPINMPYILSDKNLVTSVQDDDYNFYATVVSSSNKLKYTIKKQCVQDKVFDDFMNEIHNDIEHSFDLVSDVYNNKKILDEKIDDKEEFVVTVCFWNSKNGEMKVIYYKLETNGELYTVSKIEVSQSIFEAFSSDVLTDIFNMSGLSIENK